MISLTSGRHVSNLHLHVLRGPSEENLIADEVNLLVAPEPLRGHLLLGDNSLLLLEPSAIRVLLGNLALDLVVLEELATLEVHGDHLWSILHEKLPSTNGFNKVCDKDNHGEKKTTRRLKSACSV